MCSFGIINLEWTFNHQSFKYFENRFRVIIAGRLKICSVELCIRRLGIHQLPWEDINLVD